MRQNTSRGKTARIPLIFGILLLSAAASPLLAASSLVGAPGIVVVSPEEVLRDFTTTSADGTLLFLDANGARVRLITAIDDPQIANRGDGEFHPADPATVFEALEAIPIEFLARLEYRIYLLPYPRAGLISSSIDSRAIYVSPGVVSYGGGEVLHAMVTHEIGHAVHARHLPDEDRDAWADYAVLRGFAGDSRFHESAPHAYRPHEVFAEDFRVLFGSKAARGDGLVENQALLRSGQVPGLSDFFSELVGAWPEFVSTGTGGLDGSEWLVYPNPARPGDVIHLRSPESLRFEEPEARIAWIDVRGRRVVDSFLRSTEKGVWSMQLGGNTGRGSVLSSGTYWIRVTTIGGRSLGPPRSVRILR